LLLAQANVGQRSYSVVGQGMIDHILVSTPEERKAFFDDATGVKPFQIKRHAAVRKLKRTHQNLADVEMLLREIEPRLRSLKRQARRLEQREEVETQLHQFEFDHYAASWWKLVGQLEEVTKQFETADGRIQDERAELKKLEEEAKKFEQPEEKKDEGLVRLQTSYREAQKNHRQVRNNLFQAEKEIELSRVRAQSNWAPLPLLKILEEIKWLVGQLKKLRSLNEAGELLTGVDEALKRSETLSKKLQRPNPDDIKPDPVAVAKVAELKGKEKEAEGALKTLEEAIDSYVVKEKSERTELIEMQKALRENQKGIHLLENRRNQLKIDLARYEERQTGLTREMNEFMKDRADNVRRERPVQLSETNQYQDIQRLRYKLELIGGIDPEIVQEYEETQSRHTFLNEQVTDLHHAIKSTEKIIRELDDQIQKQSKEVFNKINKEFQRYFKMLFGGGSCKLVKLTREELKEDELETGVTPERAFADTGEEQRAKDEAIAKKIQKHQDPVIGVDIQATPPGKKLKALNLLSGGERALTSMALISAIMAVNPSPFVVLDEVDAALDEANTIRFA
ncbi:MAG: hypothetical protein P8J32_01205, partial [bacterium]|nr:hypothetical protein [bacterium]